MIRPPTTATYPTIPKVFEDFGYWVRECEDDAVSVGYKEKELASFTQAEATQDAILEVVVRHFMRISGSVGATR